MSDDAIPLSEEEEALLAAMEYTYEHPFEWVRQISFEDES